MIESVKNRFHNDPQYRKELLQRVLPSFVKANEQFANSFLYKLKYDDAHNECKGNSNAALAILEQINRNLNMNRP